MTVMVRSVHDAFEYVMDHYYPAGCEDFAIRKDNYAVISIQDTQMGGFGVRFCENIKCKGVLTLLFDDVWKEVDGAVCFTEEMAAQIIRFVQEHQNVDTILVHCYGGQSRSLAVGEIVAKILKCEIDRGYETDSPNRLVYNTLVRVYNNLKTKK